MNQKVIPLILRNICIKEKQNHVFFQGTINIIKMVPMLSMFNSVIVPNVLLRAKVSLSLPSSYFCLLYSLNWPLI